jgi:hypothetical protein
MVSVDTKKDEAVPRLVYVEWVDSAAMHGWHSLKDIREDATLAVIQSIGWLIIDTDEQKTLVASKHMDIPQNGDVCFGSDPITIPAVVIRKMVDIATPGTDTTEPV